MHLEIWNKITPHTACHCRADRATYLDYRAQWISGASLCARYSSVLSSRQSKNKSCVVKTHLWVRFIVCWSLLTSDEGRWDRGPLRKPAWWQSSKAKSHWFHNKAKRVKICQKLNYTLFSLWYEEKKPKQNFALKKNHVHLCCFFALFHICLPNMLSVAYFQLLTYKVRSTLKLQWVWSAKLQLQKWQLV